MLISAAYLMTKSQRRPRVLTFLARRRPFFGTSLILTGSFLLTACANNVMKPQAYAGAGLGASQLELDTAGTALQLEETGDTASTVALGVDLTPRLGIEGQYSDLGSAVLNNGEQVGYQTLSLSGIGRAKGGREGLNLYARLGVGMLRNVEPQGSSISIETRNAAHVVTGVGVEYGLPGGLIIRAEAVGHDADARHADISLLYRFNNPSANAPVILAESDQTGSSEGASVAREGDNRNNPAIPSVLPTDVPSVVVREEAASQTPAQQVTVTPLPDIQPIQPIIVAQAETKPATVQRPVEATRPQVSRPTPIPVPKPAAPEPAAPTTAAPTTAVPTRAVPVTVVPTPPAPKPIVPKPVVIEQIQPEPEPAPETVPEPQPVAPTPEPVEVEPVNRQEESNEAVTLTTTVVEIDAEPLEVVPDVEVADSATDLEESATTDVVTTVDDSDADGIDDEFDQCADTDSSVPVNEQGCLLFDGPVDGVEFESDNDSLTTASLTRLNSVASKLGEYPDVNLQIQVGAVDDSSESTLLARKRTLAVIRQLVRAGVRGTRLKPTAPVLNDETGDNSSTSEVVILRTLVK